ncbi:MAG: hypothetical protein ACREEG_15700, partial [Phenylobacterium sp.]
MRDAAAALLAPLTPAMDSAPRVREAADRSASLAFVRAFPMHLERRVLVSGGAGFLGKHLCELLLAEGC